MAEETKKLEGGIILSESDSAVSWLFFDVVNDHTINIQNSITDNYLENNTAVQDCISHSPITVSVKGISGELVYTPPELALSNIYEYANSLLTQDEYTKTDKLTAIPALLPPVDNLTQRAKNAVQYVEASYDRYKKIYDKAKRPIYNQSRLEKIYEELLALRNNNTLFVVVTPYSEFRDMAIASITLSQNNVNYTTDIQIDFKQINYTDTQKTKPDEKVKAWYNAAARTGLANHGLTSGQNVSISRELLNRYNPQWRGKGIFL